MILIIVIIVLSFGVINTFKCECTHCTRRYCTATIGCYSMITYNPKKPLIFERKFGCLNAVSLFIYSFLMLLVVVFFSSVFFLFLFCIL